MFVFKKTLSIVVCLIFVNNLNGDLFKDKILSIDNANSGACLVYRPYLGTVEDIESLDIKSEKFEITENEALIPKWKCDNRFP
jgi:hypothetical protein